MPRKTCSLLRVGRSRSLSSPTTCSPTSARCPDGSRDANYFQHQPYLDNYNEENGTDLVGVAKIHFEAMALYGAQGRKPRRPGENNLRQFTRNSPASRSLRSGLFCVWGAQGTIFRFRGRGFCWGFYIFRPCASASSLQVKGLPAREPLFVLLLVLLFVVEEVLALHDCQIGNRFGRRAVGVVVPVPYAFRVHIAVQINRR